MAHPAPAQPGTNAWGNSVDAFMAAVPDSALPVTALGGDWTGSRADDVTRPPLPADRPTIAWAATQSSSLTSPVTYRPEKCGLGSQTLTWDGQSDPNFLFGFGYYSTNNGAAADLTLVTDVKPGGDLQSAWHLFLMAFTTNGNTVEISGYGPYSDRVCVIEVNGRFVYDTAYDSGLPTGDWRLTLTWPTEAVRTVRLWMLRGSVGFVYVPTGKTVTKPTTTTRKVAIIGDSFVNGSGASTDWPDQGTSNLETFAPNLARALGCDSPLLLGVGGTGWVAAGDRAYSGRVAEALSYGPDVLIFSGSVNDYGLTGVQAAVDSTLASCASVPKVYVLWTPSSSDGPTWNTLRDEVKAGTIGRGRTFLDMTGVMTGTGKIGAPAGDGTNDFYRMADGTHPTLAAHRALTRRALALIAPYLV